MKSMRFFSISGISLPEVELGTSAFQPLSLPSTHPRGIGHPSHGILSLVSDRVQRSDEGTVQERSAEGEIF